MEHIVELLHELPLFQSFSPEQLQKLVAASHVETYSPQEAVIHFGQPGRFLAVILRGTAEVVVADGKGEQQRIGLRQQGDFLGEISLLTGEPTMADVIALEPCEVLLIPQEVFSTYLAANADAVRVMARALTERLRGREQDPADQSRVADAWRSTPDPYGLELTTTAPMKVLVVNCGSSSLKYSFFDTATAANNREGNIERIGAASARLVCSSPAGQIRRELGPLDHAGAFQAMVAQLTDPQAGVLRSLAEMSAVGHRVVHGGDQYGSAAVIDEQVLRDIEKSAVLAPLHNPLNLMAIRESMRLIPRAAHVAVFDTGFHQKMPPQAYLYGLPYELYEQDRLRRYGFHGPSHNYVALQAAAHLKRDFRELKLITCHLGNGASLCAIDHGRSVDTTMGLTPLEGLIMGTRCGDLDPSIILFLLREKGLTVEAVEDILNRQSGLKGLSGVSNDFRELEEAANQGEQRALQTIQTFCYRIRKYIGSYMAVLGGLDALVFTGGIGEGSARVRSLACQGLTTMGICLDDLRNKTVSLQAHQAADIADEDSPARVLVIRTDEGRMIARETIRALGYQGVAQVIRGQEKKPIPLEVSAHHVHLCQEHLEALFGPGHALTYRSPLSQPGQFACEETVTLVGPRGQVERVRVLGPLRSQTQVEISMTEEFKLGIQAPVRASGDLAGTPGLTLAGPAGTCDLVEGVICALRHLHMSPEDALSLGLKDRDVCMIKVEGARELIFGDVLVRITPDFNLSMHLDTDEANAAGIQPGAAGYLVGIQDRRQG